MNSRATLRLGLLASVLSVCLPLVARADNPDNPECLGTDCGKPKEEGGSGGAPCFCVPNEPCNCSGNIGSVWVAYTDDGKTLAYADDADGDGIPDPKDNCPFVANRDQLDSDGDGVGDACDNCPNVPNKDQSDIDGDGIGDACDPDIDGDGIPNELDNCPYVANKNQESHGGCGPNVGDACCADADGDGVPNAQDNCPLVANPDQSMAGIDPKDCIHDSDGDGVPDTIDNCVDVPNPDQKDTDGDGIGDACDKDIDGDGILNDKDNCPFVANPDQADSDRDGIGDACDPVFCYVVDPGSPDACLNPKAPFAVSAGASLKVDKGATIRLPIFANRNDVAINYQWTVTKRPSGSSSAIENPEGSVSASRDWQYFYVDGQVPTFVADADGLYEFQLAASLVFPDRVYPEQAKATSTMKLLSGTGVDSASGCSAAGGAPVSAGLWFLLLALRRRK
jgi:hypothetical protein